MTIHWAPDAERFVERAESEALRHGYSYVGTEHPLLAMLSLDEGRATDALRPYGLQRLQQEVLQTCPPGGVPGPTRNPT